MSDDPGESSLEDPYCSVEQSTEERSDDRECSERIQGNAEEYHLNLQAGTNNMSSCSSRSNQTELKSLKKMLFLLLLQGCILRIYYIC